jgi:hypothetical protein
MYYYLISSLKRRLVLELQDSFQQHPIYSKIVPFIQNKYTFTERPQFGIVVKGSNANKVALSGDNFMGTVESHVMLTYVGEPAYPLEWVREDAGAIQANQGVFPTRAGIYYIEILTVPENANDSGTFAVDPLLEATDEALLRFQSGIERQAQLENIPLQGTLRIYLNRRVLLTENVDYKADYLDGSIEIIGRFEPNAVLTADYFYPVPSIGPVLWQWNVSDVKTIPGVVLAFGKRGKQGDKVALRIYPDRVDAAQAFGGKFEATFDLDVIARDPTQMEEVADLAIMYLWGQKKPKLEFEGIEIIDISMGGEAEEVYDETADNYYYNASLSIQLRADWEIHVPMPLTISKVTQNLVQSGAKDGPSSLFFVTAPILAGRNNNFERIL